MEIKEVKENCFALLKDQGKIYKCHALKTLNCKNCAFFRTKEENAELLKKYPKRHYEIRN